MASGYLGVQKNRGRRDFCGGKNIGFYGYIITEFSENDYRKKDYAM
jgi:hypothetical protein